MKQDATSGKRVTLQTIADHLSVSKAMVSRALHGTGKVDATRREQIRAVADELGYQPDPRLGYLSALRWGNRRSGHITIAYLCDQYTGRSEQKQRTLHDYASSLGYRLERFESDKIDSKELNRLLYHRGIQAILLDLHESQHRPELDWQHFSVVAIGEEYRDLPVHRVGTDWSSVFELIRSTLLQRRPKGVAVALHPFAGTGLTRELLRETLLLRKDLAESAGIQCDYRSFPPQDKRFHQSFTNWLERLQPEAILTCSDSAFQAVQPYLRSHRGSRHYLLIDRNPKRRPRQHGVDIQLELRTRFAIDLLHLELLRDRRGLPDDPIRHLVPARWR